MSVKRKNDTFLFFLLLNVAKGKQTSCTFNMLQITAVALVFSVVTLAFNDILNVASHGICKIFADILINIFTPNPFNDLL